MEGYEAADIWNLNETGCFYEAFTEKKAIVMVGKKASSD